ncbi:MAG: hypothetical protein Q9212_007141 [Teloschistes hypoglaucus]
MVKKIGRKGWYDVKDKKKVAVKKTRDAKVIALIEANKQDSPLLSLSAEIRNMIYRYVLGDRFIRVWREGDEDHFAVPPFSIDGEAAFEAEAYERSVGGEQVDRLRHGDRYQRPRIKEFPALLRVCRQTYFEATEILYATNTFSFETTKMCSTFMKAMTQAQKNKITTIHIQFSARGFPIWKSALEGQARIKDARNLKSLHVSLKFGSWYLDHVYDDTCPPEIRSLTNLHELPLTKIMVIVDEKELTWKEKRELALFYECQFLLSKAGHKNFDEDLVWPEVESRFAAEEEVREAEQSARLEEKKKTDGEAAVDKEDPTRSKVNGTAEKETADVNGIASDGVGQNTVEQAAGDVDGSAPVAQENSGDHKEENA